MGTVSDLITDESGRYLFVVNEPGIEVTTSSPMRFLHRWYVGGDFAYQPPIYFCPDQYCRRVTPGLASIPPLAPSLARPAKKARLRLRLLSVTARIRPPLPSPSTSTLIRAQNISTAPLSGMETMSLSPASLLPAPRTRKSCPRDRAEFEGKQRSRCGPAPDPRIDVSTGFYLVANDNWSDDQNSSSWKLRSATA
jgi:hypothetical protein